MKKNNNLTIALVVGIVVLVVGGVWAFRTYQDSTPATTSLSDVSAPIGGGIDATMRETLDELKTFTIPAANVDELSAMGKPFIVVFGSPDG